MRRIIAMRQHARFVQHEHDVVDLQACASAHVKRFAAVRTIARAFAIEYMKPTIYASFVGHINLPHPLYNRRRNRLRCHCNRIQLATTCRILDSNRT